MDEVIDFNSESNIPLLKNEQSRNQFFIPILILISIIILNLIYFIKTVNDAFIKFYWSTLID